MDVTSLARTGYSNPGYPVSTRQPAGRERVLDLVAEADATPPVREPVERVVQGEVLQRQRTLYGSTQDYLNSRQFDSNSVADPNPGDRAYTGRSSSHSAVGAYLGHTRESIQPGLNRGRQVDYFV
ncbi:MAG: hypothetical protein WCZ87_08830 [Thiohalobacteraceae bacterium]